MERMTIQTGSYGENCTILADGDRAFVVDPGSEGGRIASLLERARLVPAAIMLTHAHFDHIGAIPELLRRHPDLPVFVHPGDVPMFGHPFNALPPEYPSFPAPKNVRDARENGMAEAIETPGHTPGGVCYYFRKEGLLLSGDTLFAGSVGRTDFPGGNMAKLVDSLAKLKALPDETVVVPGHGPETTIGREKKHNPYM